MRLSRVDACARVRSSEEDILGDLFYKSHGSNTKKYFGTGKCNTHNVGFCVLLEKVRSCRIKLADKGSILFYFRWLATVVVGVVMLLLVLLAV